MIVSFCLAACFVLFSHQIVALYNDEPEIVSLGGTILMFIAFIQPFQALSLFWQVYCAVPEIRGQLRLLLL